MSQLKWVEARDVAKHFPKHSIPPPQQRIFQSKISIVERLRNLVLLDAFVNCLLVLGCLLLVKCIKMIYWQSLLTGGFNAEKLG